MAVTNRGSILISTANDIGSSLVDVIGGEGYTPNEWSKKINLCGIAAADVPTALENIEESTPSGTDRGSISLDTANAVGAVLNKKFNTARGFKPSEWASAISKLTELEVKTASGSVASFDDGADDVPLKSCTCGILPVQDTSGGAPSPSNPCPITGTTEIKATHTGKNLVNGYSDYSVTNKIIGPVYLKPGDYTVSFQRSIGVSAIYVRKGDIITVTGDAYLYKYNTTFFAFSADVEGYYYFQLYRSGTSATWEEAPISNVQLERGSTVTAYEQYKGETKTAALGRTILGGSYDFISGVLTEGYGVWIIDGSTWARYGTTDHSYWHDIASGNDRPIDQSNLTATLCNIATYNSTTPASAPNWSILIQVGQRIVITADSNYSSLDDFKALLNNTHLIVCAPFASGYEQTDQLTPTQINSYYGDNNISSDVQGGNTTVEYRADIDLALS